MSAPPAPSAACARDQLTHALAVLLQYHDLDDGMRPISVIFPYLPTEFHRRRDAAREALRNIFAKARGRAPARGPTACKSENAGTSWA